jgi:hypothetical protein
MIPKSSYIAALQNRKAIDAATTCKRYLTLDILNESTPPIT